MLTHMVGDYLLDNGLTVLDTAAVAIHICSQDPANYTEATSTYSLGNKTWSAGGAWGSPAAGTPNGRKVSSTQITDGSVTGTGTATDWATVDATHLLANGGLSSSQAVTSGNTFTLASFDIRLPNQ